MEVRDLVVRSGALTAVHGVSFTVPAGGPLGPGRRIRLRKDADRLGH